jgi:hypothetical protein
VKRGNRFSDEIVPKEMRAGMIPKSGNRFSDEIMPKEMRE